MFWYAAHRQRLPLIHSRISASEPAWPSSMQATADMIWPGVQPPHWNASCRMNASCTGCSCVAPRQPLHRGDLGVLPHHGQGQAGLDPLAVDQDRARAALAPVTALLGAGQAEPLAQRVEQGHPRLDGEPVPLSVD